MKDIKTIESLTDLEAAMNRLQGCDAIVKKAAAKLSEDVAKMRDKMMDEIGEFAEQHKRLQNIIEEFAIGNRANPEIFPSGKKSLELHAGVISFRTGPLSIALKKGTKTEQVIAAAKSLKLDIIRMPEPELDKDAVKELVKEGEIDDDMLKKLGLVANQSETLNIKLNDQ